MQYFFFLFFIRCDYANNDKWRIRHHWKSCSKVEKLLDCEIGQCLKKFGTNVAISIHRKREHPELVFHCENCNYKTMKSSSNQYHKKVCGKDTTAHLGQKNFKCENENSDFKTGSKPTDNIPHSEPTLATQCPNVKSSDDQESQSIQKPVRYTHVLPKP